MKTTLLFTTLFLLLTQSYASDTNESERPSRLEAGYGNSEILDDSMPYIPKIKEDENIQFLGDLRLRSQSIKRESEFDNSVDHKWRYRARFGLNAKIYENLKLEFMLASGNGDPVSTNQSLGGGFNGKSIVIDIADVYYGYSYHSFIRAGKMKQPIYRTHKNQLIFDGDLRPEGAFVKQKVFDNSDITLGAFVVANTKDTQDASGDEIYLFTAQWIQYIADFRIMAGYYHYENLKGHQPIINDKNVTKGNTLDPNGDYLYHYYLAELAVQYDWGDLSLGADVVYNVAVDDENLGYNLSVMYGSLKKQWDYKLGYFYRYIERDSVVGAFNDSDFIGGGTDGKGHQVMGGLQLVPNTQLAFTYINAVTSQVQDDERFQRLHLDIKFTFKSK